MKQFIVQGNDGKDNLLYVVRAEGRDAAIEAVGELAGMSKVTVKSRQFLCCMNLTADEVRLLMEANALGEAGRGVYEVTAKEVREGVNLA